MKGTKLKAKNEFQDEIREACTECGVKVLKAYWDEELECYIYLKDEQEEECYCSSCQSVELVA